MEAKMLSRIWKYIKSLFFFETVVTVEVKKKRKDRVEITDFIRLTVIQMHYDDHLDVEAIGLLNNISTTSVYRILKKHRDDKAEAKAPTNS